MDSEEDNIPYSQCILSQSTIGWGHFTRGHFPTTFHSTINKCHRQNKSSKHYNLFFWYKSVIKEILKIYIKAWVDYDSLIYPPTQSKPSMSLANDNILKLVQEYHEASQGLSIK